MIENTSSIQISELEAARDLSQIIVHIDCDAFYASVEVSVRLARPPSLTYCLLSLAGVR